MSDAFKVLIHCSEPYAFKSASKDVYHYSNFFDLILTNDPSLLDLSNVVHTVYGTTSLIPGKFSFLTKEFSVSYLYSPGVGGNLQGYQDRITMWNLRNQISINTRFWSSRHPRSELMIDNPIPYPFDTKDELMHSMFTIVIENSYEPSYFTEKLLDSLISYTVPVYIGAPDIHKYFKAGSVLQASSPYDAIEIINNLTSDSYSILSDALCVDHLKARAYAKFDDIIYTNILKAYYSSISRLGNGE
jgi:hypothetical protein